MKIQWLRLNAEESPSRLSYGWVFVCAWGVCKGGVDGSIRFLWSVPPSQELDSQRNSFYIGMAFILYVCVWRRMGDVKHRVEWPERSRKLHVRVLKCICIILPSICMHVYVQVCTCDCIQECVCVCACWSEGGRVTFGRCHSLGYMCISGLMFMWIID